MIPWPTILSASYQVHCTNFMPVLSKSLAKKKEIFAIKHRKFTDKKTPF